MPRSLQQLKHRTIFFDDISSEQIVRAIQLLKSLPGVAASMDRACKSIVVDYWVDEYTFSGLEQALSSRGFPLSCVDCVCAMRAEIQNDEDDERDHLGVDCRACCHAGVFAQVCCPCRDDDRLTGQLVWQAAS